MSPSRLSGSSRTVSEKFLLEDFVSDIPAFIDTHIHFWDLAKFRYPWLESEEAAQWRSNYLPADFLKSAQGLDLRATVHVQAEVDHAIDPAAETRWLEELRLATGVPTVSVGYADLRAPDLEAVLDRHCAIASFRGIRQELWYDPGSQRADLLCENLLDDPRWAKGLAALERRGLSFDLLVWHYQMDQARAIVRELPGLNVVLEHCTVPVRDSSPGKSEWQAALAAFARDVPNSVLKISAMRFFAERWNDPEVETGVLRCIDAFGPERCMFGGDFPVERTSGEYRNLWERYAEITLRFSADERAALFAGTAARAYRISL